ncbi:translation initiation factor eIF-2B subunit gamma [Electrophorus electricus]|uniref:translation initiation factor eIF-2B subunit gamma n=1 Tax=Electrophorus electricus TaxID=8005 RepID=UPI0015D0775B|nr:translation initiation factor eIF-2B subunit gamma [Electrophorus electricus]
MSSQRLSPGRRARRKEVSSGTLWEWTAREAAPVHGQRSRPGRRPRHQKYVMRKHPRMHIRTDLLDAHLYCLKKCVVDFLVANKCISSLRGELVPYLVRKQFSKATTPGSNGEHTDQNLKRSDANAGLELLISSRDDGLLQLAEERSCWNDHHGDMSEAYHGGRLRCYAHIMEKGMCYRANTLAAYVEANRVAPKLFDESPVHPSAVVSERSLVGGDSIIGPFTNIADKTSIKRSNIGAYTVVKEKVKISNSIIMNGVTIEEGCNIQGSVICNGAVISRGADLKYCLVGSCQHIEPEAERTNDVIVGSDQLMEI